MGWLAQQCEELFRHDQWQIGVVEAPIHAFLAPGFRPAVRWLPAPGRSGFRADPFGWAGGDELQIFCEDYDAARGRGRLVVVGEQGGLQPLRGFPPAVHLSYPYLIEDQGALYCVPEMWHSGQVRLYRAARWPEEWVQEAVLLPDFAGVDATVFRHEGRWWMACARQCFEPERDLWLFHAPALRGPWQPHANNPVKRDVTSARSGGTPFVHAGALYRPAQDCSRTYGGGLALNRVVRLTPEEFAEETVVRLAPPADWPWRAGWHTLAAMGERTLLDAKRVALLPAACRRVAGHKLRRLLRQKRA
ncbi:MAG TPA: hypothetical protein VNF74_06365 [Terriglobales bacterium]|nr:hypothetical protein [Terriglobales bacterium]